MKAVVQRVSTANVAVGGAIVGSIGRGSLVLLGIANGDTERDAEYLVDKIINLRIFDDPEGKMNRSLIDIDAELLVISQFTLFADTRRGRRPSFLEAAKPELANRLYEYFLASAKSKVPMVVSGRFQAVMDVELVNDGPVTIIIDSKTKI